MNKAQATRKYILEQAFELVYQQGFQAASIDKILAGSEVTKGAFYYHFKNKEEMGLAIINEMLTARIYTNLVEPLTAPGNRAVVIYETFKRFMLSISEQQLQLGCPTNNLIQEMAPLNEKFAKALMHIINYWKETLAKVLREGMEEGSVRQGDAEKMAAFIIASYEGTRNLGKLYHSYEYYHRYLAELKNYLIPYK